LNGAEEAIADAEAVFSDFQEVDGEDDDEDDDDDEEDEDEDDEEELAELQGLLQNESSKVKMLPPSCLTWTIEEVSLGRKEKTRFFFILKQGRRWRKSFEWILFLVELCDDSYEQHCGRAPGLYPISHWTAGRICRCCSFSCSQSRYFCPSDVHSCSVKRGSRNVVPRAFEGGTHLFQKARLFIGLA
jgi:hypothetical protein